MVDTDVDALFQAYLAICNQALDRHKDLFPYKQIWDASHLLDDKEILSVALYDDTPKGFYALRMRDKHIEWSARHTHERFQEDARSLKLSYLRAVVSNPEAFINQPAKLDWNLFKDRG